MKANSFGGFIFSCSFSLLSLDSCVDISVAVIDLLQEMTDVDTLNESEEGATALIDALVMPASSLAVVHVASHFPIVRW